MNVRLGEFVMISSMDQRSRPRCEAGIFSHSERCRTLPGPAIGMEGVERGPSLALFSGFCKRFRHGSWLRTRVVSVVPRALRPRDPLPQPSQLSVSEVPVLVAVLARFRDRNLLWGAVVDRRVRSG